MLGSQKIEQFESLGQQSKQDIRNSAPNIVAENGNNVNVAYQIVGEIIRYGIQLNLAFFS